ERDIAVVEIEITDHHPIGEYGEIRAGLDTAAQYGRAVFRRYVRGELDCNLRRLRLVSADCASQCIDDDAFRAAHDFRRQILIFEIDRIVGERLADGNLIE